MATSLWFLLVLPLVYSANIFFIATEPSPYYQTLQRNLFLSLWRKGHNVTVLTTYPWFDMYRYFNIDLPEGWGQLNQIDVGSLHPKYTKKLKPRPNLNLTEPTLLKRIKRHAYVSDVYSQLAERIFNHSNVEEFLKEENTFDACVVEMFYPAMTAFASVLNCPLIALSSVGTTNPFHTHSYYNKKETGFYNTLASWILEWYGKYYYESTVLPREDKLVKKYFGEDMPYLGDLAINSSVSLINTDYLINEQEPSKTIVDIGGSFEGDDERILIKSLGVFLNTSTEGVVYVNFGPHIEATRFTRSKMDTFLKAFENLDYLFIVKWESFELYNHIKNVYIIKEPNHNRILEHENTKLFITGGDRDAIECTIRNRVPVIGIPFYAEDADRLRKLEEYGVARSVSFVNLTVEALTETIQEVISNYVYKENVIKLEGLFYDQPVSGLDTAIWWIEYIIKHGGNPRLPSSTSSASFYQTYSLEAVSILLIYVFVIICSLYKLVQYAVGKYNKQTEKIQLKEKKNK